LGEFCFNKRGVVIINYLQKMKLYKLKIHGENIKEARESRGFYKRELAEKLNISTFELNEYEIDKKAIPESLLLRLSEILNFPIRFFYKKPTYFEFFKGSIFMCGSDGCSVMINGKWYDGE